MKIKAEKREETPAFSLCRDAFKRSMYLRHIVLLTFLNLVWYNSVIIMKSKYNLLEQLKVLPYFNKNTVSQLGLQLGIKNSTVSTYISRFIKYKEIYQVKKGMYVSAAFADARRSTDSYSLYLANILRSPSYVSSWTALQYYNLTTEVIHSTTSVSLKVTRNYVTKIGTFQYQSIDKRAFCDFQLLKSDFDFFIATPSKAIFDLLYFKTRGFRGYSRRDVLMMAEDLRIDVDELSKDELTKLYLMLKKYE